MSSTFNPELPRLNIPYDTLKTVVLDILRQINKSNNSFQYNNLLNAVGHHFQKTSMGYDPKPDMEYSPVLNNHDKGLVREIIWDLIVDRCLTIGDFHNDLWPHLTITERGSNFLR